MSTLLVKHADMLVTMDAQRREIADGGLFIRDGRVEQVGPTASLPAAADEVCDLRGHLVLPGLVNTHHHLYQTLTRAVPAAQDANLFNWLKTLYPIWARLTPEAIRVSTLVGLAELALSGCTTASDHLYIFPNGCRLDDEIAAAREIGMRFHASRGSMSLGESQGGLPPDRVVETEEFILRDTRRLIETYHDPHARLHAANRGGAVLALFGDARPDARGGPAGPRLRGAPAHAPGRDPRRRAVLRGAVWGAPGALCRAAGLGGRRRVARARRVGERGRDSAAGPHRHGRGPLPLV